MVSALTSQASIASWGTCSHWIGFGLIQIGIGSGRPKSEKVAYRRAWSPKNVSSVQAPISLSASSGLIQAWSFVLFFLHLGWISCCHLWFASSWISWKPWDLHMANREAIEVSNNGSVAFAGQNNTLGKLGKEWRSSSDRSLVAFARACFAYPYKTPTLVLYTHGYSLQSTWRSVPIGPWVDQRSRWLCLQWFLEPGTMVALERHMQSSKAIAASWAQTWISQFLEWSGGFLITPKCVNDRHQAVLGKGGPYQGLR